jgi:diamine N-acetyltransferase
MVNIRPATIDDYDAISALFAEGDRLHAEHLPSRFRLPTGIPRSRQLVESCIVGPDATILLADDDGRGVGFAQLVVRDAPPNPILIPTRVGVLDTIVVSAADQRRGIGRLLLDAAVAWFRSRAASQIELNVYEFNHSAIAFYESLGFTTRSRTMVRGLDPDPSISALH